MYTAARHSNNQTNWITPKDMASVSSLVAITQQHTMYYKYADILQSKVVWCVNQ